MQREQAMSRLSWIGGAVVLSVAAYAGPAVAQSKIIRSIPQVEPRNLDPLVSTHYGTRNHGHLIYEQLFALDSKLDPKPMMVGEHKVSADELTHTMLLRPGQKWHDGAPVTAADCVASLKRWLKRDGFGQKLDQAMVSLTADDEKTITLKLKYPFPLLLEGLAKPSGYAAFMMPERFAKLPIRSPEFKPIGSGPFVYKADERRQGHLTVYVRNPNYVPRSEPADGMAGGKVVKIDRLEWITTRDVNTAANALIAGEVDVYESLSFPIIPQLKADKNVIVRVTDKTGNQPYLRMNHLHAPFNNIKARQALLLVVDQKLYGQAVAGDPSFYSVCPAYLMCGSRYGSTAGAVKPDLAKARQLMKEAGYKGEKVVVLEPTDNTQFDAASLVTASQLRKIGVNVELAPMDFSSMMIRRNSKNPIDKGGWSLAHSGNFGLDVASPLTNVYLNSTCEKAAAGWPCDKQIEDLKTEFSKARTDAERMKIAEKIQLRAVEFVPYVPVMQTFTTMAYRKTLKGMLETPIVVYWNVEK
jgi:peptide/nickel transport system substrate-binding protein